MKFKAIIAAVSCLMFVHSVGVSAATVIGTYSMEATATLVSGQGMAYNGTNWYFGSNTNWQININDAWLPSAAPTELNDISAATLLAAQSNSGTLSLNLGFTGTHVVNGTGSDLAFFFLLDQSANTANVTINGVTQGLSFHDVYNNLGERMVVNGVNWGGTTYSNVRLMVGEVDLSSFGLLAGAAVTDPFNISLRSNGDTAIALSMVGAMHTGPGTVVPLPAPFVLLFSGLAVLGLIGRRCK